MSITSILGETQLQALRDGYDAHVMFTAATASLEAPFPAAAPWIEAVGDHFYATQRELRATSRETALLAIFTVTRDAPNLAIHVYWALMTGHSPEQVCETLYLAGAYAGLPAYRNAMIVAGKVFTLLAKLVAEGVTDCQQVVPAIGAAVPA